MSGTTNDIERLKREYRELRAPQHLAGRIRARVRGSGGARPRSAPIPALAALAAALGAVALLVALPWRVGGEAEVRPTSLTVLSLAARSRPHVAVPGLSSVPGMTLPPAPSRPMIAVDTGLPPAADDQELEDLRNHSRTEEEKDHANS